ncbi:DAK2 domain-containing protein [Streptomyces galilaeus]
MTEPVRGFSDGIAIAQRLGGTKPGDKTIVDALAPATGDLSESLTAAAVAASSGAEEIAHLLAKRDRTGYVRRGRRGVLDPGAVAVAVLVESARAD